MASTSPQINSAFQHASCQNTVRVQGPAKTGNFSGSIYAPIFHILHDFHIVYEYIWTVISTMCSLLVLVQETVLSLRCWRLTAYLSQMKRTVVLAVWVKGAAEVPMDPVEIGVAVTCCIISGCHQSHDCSLSFPPESCCNFQFRNSLKIVDF